jgi:hypothetical protein
VIGVVRGSLRLRRRRSKGWGERKEEEDLESENFRALLLYSLKVRRESVNASNILVSRDSIIHSSAWEP